MNLENDPKGAANFEEYLQDYNEDLSKQLTDVKDALGTGATIVTSLDEGKQEARKQKWKKKDDTMIENIYGKTIRQITGPTDNKAYQFMKTMIRRNPSFRKKMLSVAKEVDPDNAYFKYQDFTNFKRQKFFNQNQKNYIQFFKNNKNKYKIK